MRRDQLPDMMPLHAPIVGAPSATVARCSAPMHAPAAEHRPCPQIAGGRHGHKALGCRDSIAGIMNVEPDLDILSNGTEGAVTAAADEEKLRQTSLPAVKVPRWLRV
jgi:hypothetical protein